MQSLQLYTIPVNLLSQTILLITILGNQHYLQWGPQLKTDYGGNLNHSSLTDLPAEDHVLPLDSLCHHDHYNGAFEHAQGELRRRIRKDHNQLTSLNQFILSTEFTAYDLNHLRRRRM